MRYWDFDDMLESKQKTVEPFLTRSRPKFLFNFKSHSLILIYQKEHQGNEVTYYFFWSKLQIIFKIFAEVLLNLIWYTTILRTFVEKHGKKRKIIVFRLKDLKNEED